MPHSDAVDEHGAGIRENDFPLHLRPFDEGLCPSVALRHALRYDVGRKRPGVPVDRVALPVGAGCAQEAPVDGRGFVCGFPDGGHIVIGDGGHL